MVEDNLRFPSVSGKFYPVDPKELSELVNSLVKSAPSSQKSGKGRVKALIVPKSSYTISGDIYGIAYHQLTGEIIDEVFLMGESTFHQVDKSAFATFREWQTPLGKVEQSHRISQIIMSDDPTSKDLLKSGNDKHHGEADIELQLPFLQEVINGEFRIIPFLVGKVSPRLLSRSLVKHIDQDDLIIVPAELSHSFPSEYGEDIDKQSINNILKLNSDFFENSKCEVSNPVGISTLIHIARLKGWKADLLTYQNIKVDTYGNDGKSNGYVAIAFYG